jgi:hypothetical protein
MSSRTRVRALRGLLVLILLATICLAPLSTVQAGGWGRGAVGGVVIQLDGLVQNATLEQRHALAKLRREEVQEPARAMKQAVELRKISLKALEAACEHYWEQNNGELPDEVKYLGGLQRVQYVLVYPEHNDIVLAGPAEGWKVDPLGNIVGITTGRPVLQLDDLIVALRTVETARQGGISCSINPTPEGHQALHQLLERHRNSRQTPNISVLEQQMKQAFGPQQVTLTGIPDNSHFARVLVAADYRMKRLAMKLDPSPIRGFPSYIDLIKGMSSKDPKVNPRWWLACNYEPVAKSDDDLAWELRGQGVKCLTEDDLIMADGRAVQTGRRSPAAQQWADLMTKHFEQLAMKEPVFGELRNLMDLTVVAALIDQYDLTSRAGCSLPMLMGSHGGIVTADWPAPKTVPPECSFMQTSAGLLVTASGGVQIESFQVASQTELSDAVKSVRQQIQRPADPSWWWN